MHNALKEIGIDADNVVTRKNVLKDSFVKTPLYKEGYVFINDRKPKSRINGVLPSIKGSLHYLSLATGLSGEDLVMEDESPREEKGSTYTTEIMFKEVAGLNYAIINKALAKYPSYRFAALKEMYPNLTSMREFITSDDYFGGIRLIIKSKYSTLPVSVLNNAVNIVVKYDKRSRETNNFYIEYQERMWNTGSWVDSGILKDDNSRFFLYGTMSGYVIFERETLLDYYERLIDGERIPGIILVREQQHQTSKGFILKLEVWQDITLSVEQVIHLL